MAFGILFKLFVLLSIPINFSFASPCYQLFHKDSLQALYSIRIQVDKISEDMFNYNKPMAYEATIQLVNTLEEINSNLIYAVDIPLKYRETLRTTLFNLLAINYQYSGWNVDRKTIRQLMFFKRYITVRYIAVITRKDVGKNEGRSKGGIFGDYIRILLEGIR